MEEPQYFGGMLLLDCQYHKKGHICILKDQPR